MGRCIKRCDHPLPDVVRTRENSPPLPSITDSHPTLELPPGIEIAGCRIEGIAGRGGMGVVYRATQLDLNRPVAVKVIASDRARDPGLRTRFSLEAKLAASIDHPNLIPVHAAGEQDGRLYIVMRYVAGTDLHRALRRDGALAPARAARVVSQVAAGLDAAHAAGLVHRDVKPANVMLAGEHVYLADFGLSRLQGNDERVTESGAWVGTVDYMSPEHLRGEPTDARSDVYALGCVLYAALTGEPPFRRPTVPATMSAHFHDAPPRPSSFAGVPAEFDAVIARALAKRPEDRYPSTGDLGRAAVAAAAGEPVTEAERTVATGAAAPTMLTTAMPTEFAPPSETVALWSGRTERGPEAPPSKEWDAPAHAPMLRRHRAWVPRRGALALLLVATISVSVAAYMLYRDGPTNASANAQLTSGDVRDAVDSFACAIASEDPAALSRVLAKDVQRVFPSDSQRGRAAVLATYATQFRGNQITGYDITNVDASGGRAGRATGRYELRRSGRDATGGSIVIGVRRERGKPKIALIAAQPD
jgi:Protein kinase domain